MDYHENEISNGSDSDRLSVCLSVRGAKDTLTSKLIIAGGNIFSHHYDANKKIVNFFLYIVITSILSSIMYVHATRLTNLMHPIKLSLMLLMQLHSNIADAVHVLLLLHLPSEICTV